jgi:hypothetical protein
MCVAHDFLNAIKKTCYRGWETNPTMLVRKAAESTDYILNNADLERERANP